MKVRIANRPVAAAALLLLSLSGAPRSACASWGEQLDSVHFNSGQPDFGLPPARGGLYEYEFETARGSADPISFRYGVSSLSFSGQDIPNPEFQSPAERAARAQAATAESKADWKTARELYRQIAIGTRWTGDLRDRVETLTEAMEPGNAAAISPDIIRRYLRAVDAVSRSYAAKWSGARQTFVALAADERAGFLRAHAWYQIASIDAGWFDYRKAIAEYRALLHDYPHTVKREAALIMIARCAILPETAESRDIAAGAQALHTLRADYPASHFGDATRGLQARLDYLQGRYPLAFNTFCVIGDAESARIVLKAMNPQRDREAYHPLLLCAYLRQMNDAQVYPRYTSAIRGIERTIAEMTPAGARTFVAAMRHDPAGLAAPYFYYRLYHCDNEPKDLKRLLPIARTFTPNARRLPPAVRVRLAEVFYQAGQLRDALDWARTAKGMDAAGKPYDRALYVEGATWNRLHHIGQARADFETLLAHCPYSELRRAARENLAIIAEAQDDLSTALDHYFALNYRTDIAFFLDARMTTAQVAAFVASHPHHPERSLLVYSLGIRRLRDEDWAGARRALAALSHAEYVKCWKPAEDYYSMDKQPQPSPLQTIADLSRLQRVALNAPTRTARASAQFRYASYYYNKGTLLLYNNALWRGGRIFNFEEWWNHRHATAEDDRVSARYMDKHEVYAHAAAVCEKIARDYPDTPTAPYALYRAACAANNLATFNLLWDTRKQERKAAHLLSRLYRGYPRCPLAKEARKYARVFTINANALDKEERDAERAAGKATLSPAL